MDYSLKCFDGARNERSRVESDYIKLVDQGDKIIEIKSYYAFNVNEWRFIQFERVLQKFIL